MTALIIIMVILLAVLPFSSFFNKNSQSIKQENNPKKEIIDRRRKFVASLSPTAKIIVNNGTFLFFIDNTNQVFGIDDSGITYCFSDVAALQTGYTYITIYLNHIQYSNPYLELGKSNLSKEDAIPIDGASIYLITNALLPIVRKNIHKTLTEMAITPTHEYVNRGDILGCDINSRKFYFTFGSLHINDFSQLINVEVDDFTINPSYFGCSYRISVTIEEKDTVLDTDKNEYWINVDEREILNDLLAMFKGIKNRQDTPVISHQSQNNNSIHSNRSIDSIDELSGVEFEHVCQCLVEKMGFFTQTTKTSRDGGIDLIAFNHQPLLSGKYIIQCKRYSGSVGEPIIRDLYGVVMSERANKGILMTTGQFTKSAYAFAQGKPLELIDGAKLKDLLCQYNLCGGNLTYSTNSTSSNAWDSSSIRQSSSLELSPQVINLIGDPGCPGVKRLQEYIESVNASPDDIRARCLAIENLHGVILIYLDSSKDDILGLHEASGLLYTLIAPLLTTERKNSPKFEDRFLYYVSLTISGESLFWQGKLFEAAKLWKEVLDDWIDLKEVSFGATQYRAELMMSICSTLSILGKLAQDSLTENAYTLSALENAKHYGEIVADENRNHLELRTGLGAMCIYINSELVDRLVNVIEKPEIIMLGIFGYNEISRLLCDKESSLETLPHHIQAEVDDDGKLTLRPEDSDLGSNIAENLNNYAECIYRDAVSYFKVEEL